MSLRLPRKKIVFVTTIFAGFYIMFLLFLHTDEPDMHEHQQQIKVGHRYIKHPLRKHPVAQTQNNARENTTTEKDKKLWIKEQEKRIKRMRKVCRFYQASDYSLTDWMHFNHDSLKNVLVSDKYKTLYCYVPKAACTNWKRAFLFLNGVVDNEKDAVQRAHKHMPNTSLDTYSKEEALFRIQNYYKFIFVRDPSSRTLSAFREKFDAGRRNRFRWLIRLANSMYFQFGNHTLPPKREPLPKDGYNVSFQEFVRYLGAKHAKLDLRGSEHWRPMNDICHPCQIDYDAIGKFETFDNDAKQVLRVLNRTDLEKVLLRKSDHPTGSSSDTLLTKYYANLTNEEKQGINWRYREDLAVFGYSPLAL